MLVSTIIANGRLLADVPNTNFYTDAEALFAVQASWKDLYSLLCENGDDYFTTAIYVTSASFNADANRQYTYLYSPTDMYRLRLLQYQGSGGSNYIPAHKMNIENFGNTQHTPAYRIVGSVPVLNQPANSTIMIYDPSGHVNWCVWYYPSPATLATTTDLNYPLSMIPEVMAYQVAIEIRRKQNIDYKSKEERRNELLSSMKKQLIRDEAKAETIKNVFGQGFAPYI